jgi:hypothetical protein
MTKRIKASTENAHLKRKYNDALVAAGLGMERGKFMTNAPKSQGKTIVSDDASLERADSKAYGDADISRARRPRPTEDSQATRSDGEADFNFTRDGDGGTAPSEEHRMQVRGTFKCEKCGQESEQVLSVVSRRSGCSLTFSCPNPDCQPARGSDLTARRHSELADCSGGFRWGKS